MTSERRFEQDLPDLLAQVGIGPTPDYRDFVVQQTARMSQRPAWTFPKRWLPMTAFTQAVAPPRFPWRYVAIGALLILALVGAALLAGSVFPHVPAPFGPAKNGLIAYDDGGLVYLVDPTTGTSTALTNRPAVDTMPVFSRDGSHLAVVRRQPGVTGRRIWVMTVDGRDAHVVTPDPINADTTFAFSPDGRQVAYTMGRENALDLWLTSSDGIGTPRQVATGMKINEFQFVPPDGRNIAFTSGTLEASGTGIYELDLATGNVLPILKPSAGVGRDVVSVSPDGSRLAYSAGTDPKVQNTYVVHVVGIDGTNDIALEGPPGTVFQDRPVWSNDGTRLALFRGYSARNKDMRLAAAPADGSGPGIETEPGLTGCCDGVSEWAPDDSFVLTRPIDLDSNPTRQIIWDPTDGKVTHVSWPGTTVPTLQRRAP